MEENNQKDKFIIFLTIIFILFLIIYFANEKGYYQYKAYNKMLLTNENIKKFENDIEKGKDVTINNYITKEYTDYSNTFTDLGYNIGKYTEKIMNKGIKKTLKILSALFFD